MKKILLVVIAISVTLLLSSCVGLTNISTPQTVALNQGNFKFVKSVSAETKALYVFGIGGFNDSATEDVIEKLRIVAKLELNQALADIRIKTTKKIYLGIVVKRILTASATVVEFCDINSSKNIEKGRNTFYDSTIKRDSIKECIKEPLDLDLIENNKDSINVVDLGNPKIQQLDVLSLKYDTLYYEEQENIRNLVYQQLLSINNSLNQGEVDNINSLKVNVNKIRKWYNSISYTYPEIGRLLREIKRKI